MKIRIKVEHEDVSYTFAFVNPLSCGEPLPDTLTEIYSYHTCNAWINSLRPSKTIRAKGGSWPFDRGRFIQCIPSVPQTYRPVRDWTNYQSPIPVVGSSQVIKAVLQEWVESSPDNNLAKSVRANSDWQCLQSQMLPLLEKYVRDSFVWDSPASNWHPDGDDYDRYECEMEYFLHDTKHGKGAYGFDVEKSLRENGLPYTPTTCRFFVSEMFRRLNHPEPERLTALPTSGYLVTTLLLQPSGLQTTLLSDGASTICSVGCNHTTITLCSFDSATVTGERLADFVKVRDRHLAWWIKQGALLVSLTGSNPPGRPQGARTEDAMTKFVDEVIDTGVTGVQKQAIIEKARQGWREAATTLKEKQKTDNFSRFTANFNRRLREERKRRQI